MVALVGGVITALLYTDRGRQTLQKMESALDEFSDSLKQLRGTIQKAGAVAAQSVDVASESVQMVAQLIGKGQSRGDATLH
jgi:methyl-accepting chemotaxis protein